MDNREFGLFLNKLRKEKNLTQQDLADKLHVTRQAISKWEKGVGYPDISMLTSIAKELDVSVDELMNARKDFNANKKNNKILIIVTSIILLLICLIFVANLNRDKTPKMFKTIIDNVYEYSDEVIVEDYYHNDVSEKFRETYQEYYDNKDYYYIFTNSAGKYIFNGRIDIN